jgi:hypothetical protein
VKALPYRAPNTFARRRPRIWLQRTLGRGENTYSTDTHTTSIHLHGTYTHISARAEDNETELIIIERPCHTHSLPYQVVSLILVVPNLKNPCQLESASMLERQSGHGLVVVVPSLSLPAQQHGCNKGAANADAHPAEQPEHQQRQQQE